MDNFISNDDPPVPQGATKFSYSATISNCRILICDTGLDFLDVKVNIYFGNYVVSLINVYFFSSVVWRAIVHLRQTIEWC